MLNGVENIDLTPFNESSDRDYLVDAFLEAQYQNPLILGIESAGISDVYKRQGTGINILALWLSMYLQWMRQRQKII